MAEVIKCITFIIKLIFIIFLIQTKSSAIEIIRDTELEQFTNDLLSTLLNSSNIQSNELNVKEPI